MLEFIGQGRQELQRLAAKLARDPVLEGVLNAAELGALVLNDRREVVYANAALLGLVDHKAEGELLGKLQGAALRCINAALEGGCGKTPECEGCGARALVECSQTARAPASDECMLTVTRGEEQEPLMLQMSAVPINFAGEALTVVTVRDVSAERRRHALERVFFHDVLNTITGLLGYVKLLEETADSLGPDDAAVVERIVRICDRLKREVMDQRALLAAETGMLRPAFAEEIPASLLENVRSFFDAYLTAAAKKLRLKGVEESDPLVTDRAILERVLINMVKNAIEAVPPGETVELGCRREEDHYLFWVWNPGQIPSEVAASIFKRAISTKGGRGRGLGTYSMKLFGERYLEGKVGFNTSAEGTVFTMRHPLTLTAP